MSERTVAVTRRKLHNTSVGQPLESYSSTTILPSPVAFSEVLHFPRPVLPTGRRLTEISLPDKGGCL